MLQAAGGTERAQRGGTVVCEALAELGCDAIFSVSGNQVLSIYDAAGDVGIRIVHQRHESAAAYAAAAYAEMRGRPGVALVSAGPGFLASLTGVAVTRSMELPLVLLSGATPTTQRGRGAFQELDQAAAAGVACKASFEVPSPDQIGHTISKAWRLAGAGIPGPVHVSLPVDILNATNSGSMTLASDVTMPPVTPDDKATLVRMAERLSRADRPAFICRPSAARGPAGEAARAIASRLGIPLLITESPRGLSDLKYGELIRQLPNADCLLVVAPADFAAGFLDAPLIAPTADVLLIDAPGDPEPRRGVLARVQLPPSTALPYLAGAVPGSAATPEWVSSIRPGDLPAWDESADDGVHPLAVAAAIREQVRPDDTLVLDGGEFCQWVRWGLRDLPNRLLWNGKLGAIGGGIPLAIGVAAAGPPGRVIVVLGDGSAGYHLSEFETAARYGLSFVAIVGNDARWAAEWHQQVRRFGADRTFETDLLPARYDLAATGYGGAGSNVADLDSLRTAMREHLDTGGAACINVAVRAVQSPALVE